MTTTKNVERTVYDKVPRQVETQRKRIVIDKVPKTITERVAQKVQRKVSTQVVDTVLKEKTIRTPRQVKVPTVQRVAVAPRAYGYGGYNRGYKW